MSTTYTQLHRSAMVLKLALVASLALGACIEWSPTSSGGNAASSSDAIRAFAQAQAPIIIMLSPATVELEADETLQIDAAVFNRAMHSVPGRLKWTSGDAAVATVSDDGLVTAVGAGTTLITAHHGHFTGSMQVTVIPQAFVWDITVTGQQNAGIYGIDGTSATNVWFGCGSRCAMRFDGTQWTRLSLGFGSNIYGANVQRDGTAYFGAQLGVGTGHVLRWNGSFAAQTPTAPSELFAVWSDAPGTGFACGDGRMLRFRAGQPTQNIATGLNLAFNSPDRLDGGAWGSSETNVFCGGRSGLYNYNGVTFSRVVTARVYDVTGTSSSNIWSVGTSGALHHFDGSTWSAVDAGQGTSDVHGIGVVSDSWVVVGTSDNRVLVYNGARWWSQPTPPGYQVAAAGLYAPDRRTVFLAGWRMSDNQMVIVRGRR